MADVSSSLLDYVLDLLGGGDAAAGFAADPEGALHAAGLAGVCGADLDAVLPVVMDYAPIALKAGAAGAAGGAAGAAGGAAGSAGAAGGVWAAPIVVAPAGDHAAAVQTLQNIVQNYSYTSTMDDHSVTVLDQSQNLAISAGDDIDDLDVDFDNHSVVTSGDGNIVGDDNNVGNTIISDSGNTHVEDSGNTHIEDSGNDSSDNSVRDNSINDSGNTAISDSGNSDNDGLDIDGDVAVDASTDSSVNVHDNTLDASTDNSVDVHDNDLDFSTDDSVNVHDNTVDLSDNSVDVHDNAVAIDDAVAVTADVDVDADLPFGE